MHLLFGDRIILQHVFIYINNYKNIITITIVIFKLKCINFFISTQEYFNPFVKLKFKYFLIDSTG